MLMMKFLSALVVSLFLTFGSIPTEAANPCAGNACNPCVANACNPCAGNACNPCGENKPIRSEHITDQAKMVAMGKKLWNDESLGNSGFSCMTCHEDHDKLNIGKHKGAWPHYVHMTKDIVTLDQMINFCMINPMEGEQLDPNGIKMTAIAAYYPEFIKSYMPGSDNPCAGNACNPCAANACNPCAGNACNPCAK